MAQLNMETELDIPKNKIKLKANSTKPIIAAIPSKNGPFTDEQLDRIIQMAWEDRTPFEAIEFQFGLKEKDVIEFMRKNSLPSSFRMWRKRMSSRKTKHSALRQDTINRFKCNRQRGTGNKISKR